jgi:hypothetical protein
MRYKVGDRVRIKSLDWYNENKDEFGVSCSTQRFTPNMSWYCGKILIISCIIESKGCYKMLDAYYYWTDEMIECKVEEETTSDKVIEEAKTYWDSIKDAWICPEGYQFKDENGNVINAQKIVLEKKKKREYPKTYEECCKVMGINHTNDLDICEHCDYKTEITFYEDSLLEKIESLYRLIICRDSYWKIAGEEIGLGKPWEPDYKNEYQKKYCIYNRGADVAKGVLYSANSIFAFPTEEMRDAFYEAFKKEIELVKELL